MINKYNLLYFLIIKLILCKKPACLKVCSHLAHVYRLRRSSRGIIIASIQVFTGIVYNPPFTMVLNFVPLNEGSNSKVAYNHQLYTLKNIVDLSEGSYAKIRQSIAGMKFGCFLTPEMASKSLWSPCMQSIAQLRQTSLQLCVSK